MAIDIRANVTCNLGPLISATFSDDYVQGVGLIKTKGSCEIAAVINPRIGSGVSFQYSTGTVARRIPKVLKVLGSFADPFRRVTSVEFGCQLTYMEDVTEPIKLDAFGDPINSGLTDDDREEILLRISAQYIGKLCLGAIGIGGTLPLKSVFTSEGPFDLSAGYVNVLSDLLVSESYCGYIGPDGDLKTFSLKDPTGPGRLITENDIVDVGPLNFGQLPGDTVIVNYTTLKLAAAEDEDEPQPEEEEEEEDGGAGGGQGEAEDEKRKLDWTLEVQENAVETIFLSGSYIPLVSNTSAGEWQAEYSAAPIQTITTEYDDLDRVVERTTLDQRILASVNSSYVGQYVSYMRESSIGNTPVVSRKVEKKFYRFNYLPPPDAGDGSDAASPQRTAGYDDVIYETTEVYEPAVVALGGVPLDFYGQDTTGNAPADFFFDPGFGEVLVERTEVRYETYARNLYEFGAYVGYFPSTKTTTIVSKIFGKTSSGQNYFSKKKEEGEGSYTMREGYGLALTMTNLGASSRIVHGREAVMEGRPGREERLLSRKEKDEAKKETDEAPSSTQPPEDRKVGSRTEQKTEIELIYTNGGIGRKIEFDMPYAPDDTFIRLINNKPGGGVVVRYRTIKGPAAQQAALFGRVQNALLMGNRSGMSIQLSADLMPSEPFSKLILQANGITGVYATNGTSWTMDSNGIVASTDALLLGVAGGA